MMVEVCGGISISGGNNEPAKIDARMKQRGWWCRRVSPRASSMWSCRTVEGEEEDGEIDADVKVEV